MPGLFVVRVPNWLEKLIPMWGFILIGLLIELRAGLSKKARVAFRMAVTAMVMKASTLRTNEMVQRYKDGVFHAQLKRVKRFIHPFAWRERLSELRGYLPAFEAVEESMTKNRGNKGNKRYPVGVSSRRRTDRSTLETLGFEEDPVVGLRQVGRGPWVLVNGVQVGAPVSGEYIIEWHLIFLSGRVANTKAIIKDGKVVSFRAQKKDQPWFSVLKPRMMEFIKFGSPYELDHPILLDPDEIEELKGLIAAERASEYLELSKTARGRARRGTRETLAKEPSTEEDMFRDRRAAKAIQKRTNRSPEEGIGEYDGPWDADPNLVIEQEEKPTWPTREDLGLGREHPARHFRISMFHRWDSETKKLAFETGPVTLNRDTLAVSRGIEPGKWFERKILDFRGLKEAIYKELEWGDQLFWAESYKGQWGYPYEHLGIRTPRAGFKKLVKVVKERLACRQCGQKVWRLEYHAEVCDHCGSEGFPRAWINVLISAFRLREFISYEKGATHIQVRLYGRAVNWVIQQAFNKGMDITKINVERRVRPDKVIGSFQWATPGYTPKSVMVPVGLGRLVWGNLSVACEEVSEKDMGEIPNVPIDYAKLTKAARARNTKFNRKLTEYWANKPKPQRFGDIF